MTDSTKSTANEGDRVAPPDGVPSHPEPGAHAEASGASVEQPPSTIGVGDATSGGDRGGMPGGLPDEQVKKKRDMLFETYKEVLDATKHQDDKIGRLLTAISFLTAAVLALANLASGQHLLRRFSTPPFELPYALICLGIFLIGVFFTVVFLLASFSTPLRFPGLNQAKRRPKSIHWVGNVPTSQLYFTEIAGVSVDEWSRKWDSRPSDLEQERIRSLILETHNLSVRTNFKYDRSVEATAVLSVALLGFVMAAVFVFLAAGSQSGGTTIAAVEFTSRTLLAAILSLYTAVHLINRIRYNRQAVDETTLDTSSKRVLYAQRSFAVILPAAIFVSVCFDSSWPRPVVTLASIIILAQSSVIAFALAAWPSSGATITVKGVVTRLWPALVIIPFAVTACVGVMTDRYGFQLTSALVGVVVLLLLATADPAIKSHRARKLYRARMTQN